MNLGIDLKQVWTDYPEGHAHLAYITKFFWIIQLSYWLHVFPEIYFQKVKREDLSNRITYGALYLFFSAAAYFLQ